MTNVQDEDLIIQIPIVRFIPKNKHS